MTISSVAIYSRMKDAFLITFFAAIVAFDYITFWLPNRTSR